MPRIFDDVLVPWAASRVGHIEGSEYIPRTGPAIIVPNHISYFDPIILFGYMANVMKRKPHFMALTAHWQFLGAQTIAKWTQTAFVNVRQPATVLDRMHGFLQRGDTCVIYPEGTRNPTSELKRGKTGAARLALWSHAPVIPLGIIGPSTRNVYRSWMDFLQNKKYTLRFGPPITLDAYYDQDITKELLTDITRIFMHAIGSLCGKPYAW